VAILRAIPAVLCFLVLGAHFYRQGSVLLPAGCVAMIILLFIHDRRMIHILRGILVLAAIEWVFTTFNLMQERQAEHREWIRGAVILLVVAGFNLISAALLRRLPKTAEA